MNTLVSPNTKEQVFILFSKKNKEYLANTAYL